MRISGIKPSFISDPKPHEVLRKIIKWFLKIPQQVEVKRDRVIKPYIFNTDNFDALITLGIKRSGP